MQPVGFEHKPRDRRKVKWEEPPLQARTSPEWLQYYRENAASPLEIPWEAGAEVLPEELEEIKKSLQAWQLGESSDGAHLLRAAESYVASTADPTFVAVARLFIKEEQRHGEMLGRFLDMAGAGRISKDWGDTLFRAFRYSLPSMEVWATPVIMVETIALLYYQAIHDATHSRVLRQICRQILQDEVPHIRFQYERLAILQRGRPRSVRWLTRVLQRLLFTAVCVAVWAAHRRAFKAGGYGFCLFWKQSWEKMGQAWQRTDPDKYEWKRFDHCPGSCGTIAWKSRTAFPLTAAGRAR